MPARRSSAAPVRASPRPWAAGGASVPRIGAHVFGYGSLVAAPGARPAVLRGHRRVWGVAMDNRVVIPGYKVFERPDGSRPPVDIAFLDLAGDPRATVNGALLAVDERALEHLDARERQYRRVEVGAHVAPRPAGSVWTYVGRTAARARVREGAPVVQRAYLELVERAFAGLGAEALAAYRASTEAVPFPVEELARVDL